MADLFEAAREERRQRLRDLGWHEVGGLTHGAYHWRRPDGAVVTEDEAFRQLDRLDKEGAE